LTNQFSHNQKVLTIWSAPNYCFRFQNKAFAVALTQGSTELRFLEVLEAQESRQIEATVKERVSEIDKYFS
jgi:hypothetical protein